MNIWRKIISHLDHRLVNTDEHIITRQELLTLIYGQKYSWYPWTVDNYRRYLTKAGYLKWLSSGRYEVVKSPLNKRLLEVKDEAYPGTAIKEKLRRKDRSINNNFLYTKNWRRVITIYKIKSTINILKREI